MTNAQESAKKIREIGNAARKVFFEREEAIHAMECALVSGEHLIMLGPPGTAKSAIARYFAEAMDLEFYTTLLNPDTVKESIFGPISAKQLAESDTWTRKWSGLATADIAFMDEIGKASNQVINLLLTAMEEREAREAGNKIDLPIHTIVSASNETLDGDAAAAWDRFTVRLIVREIGTLDSFIKMLTTDIEDRPCVPVSRDELKGMRTTARHMAKTTPTPVLAVLGEMKSERPEISQTYISDRRWSRTLRVAAGRALLYGHDEIRSEDLIVSKWMLWDDVDEVDKVHKWVEDKVFADIQALRDAQELLGELLNEARDVENADNDTQASIIYRSKKLVRLVNSMKDNRHQKEWDYILGVCHTLEERVLDA